MPRNNYWYFNTDETETEGENAYQGMIGERCIAAWGNCRGIGANDLLRRPNAGDLVFLYRAGYGMVARGAFTEEKPIKSQTVFAQRGEYSRKLSDFVVLPKTRLLTACSIREATGYDLPARHILCKIHNGDAKAFLAEYFEKHGNAVQLDS